MDNDMVVLVDTFDKVLGAMSKREAHTFTASAPHGHLHRAFSCFLFDDEGRMLLTKRAASKLIFPSVWTNACCSHPLHGRIPDEVDTEDGNHQGIKHAAIRKLGQELGISSTEVPFDDFCHLGRAYYWAEDHTDEHGNTWGEHEIDHILFMQAGVTLAPNADEVEEAKYVTDDELRAMLLDETLIWSPWFVGIMEKGGWEWWADLKTNKARLRNTKLVGGGGGIDQGGSQDIIYLSKPPVDLLLDNLMSSADGGFPIEAIQAELVPDHYTKRVTTLQYPARWITDIEYSRQEREKLVENVREWMCRFGAMDLPGVPRRFDMMECDEFGGRAHLIVGPNREGAELTIRYVVLFVLWDDFVEGLYEESPEAAIANVRDIQSILLGEYDGLQPPADPILAMWQDWFASVRDFYGQDSVFYRRFVDTFYHWMDNMGEEFNTVCWVDPTSVDLDAMWHVRTVTIGCPVTNVLMEMATDTTIPVAVYERPEITRIMYLMCFICRVANELGSFSKDLLDGCGNLFFYTMLQKSWTVEQTMDHFVALHDDAVEEVDRLEAQLSAEGLLDANHVEFLTYVRQHIIGFNEFYMKAKRYIKWAAVDHKEQTVFKVVIRSVDEVVDETKAESAGVVVPTSVGPAAVPAVSRDSIMNISHE